MRLVKILLIVLLPMYACKSESKVQQVERFDKAKWSIRDGKQFPFREQMLDDLIANQKLKGLKKQEVLDLLGEPSRVDSNYLFYNIKREYFADLIVLRSKTLVIKLMNDTVEWRKIHE
jgi:outer membrane protein assembly factor BamE (lipoprotein component of BamABCDE complex)